MVSIGGNVFWETNVCCCCSVTWSCLTLCCPMAWSTAGFPVLHHLPEFAQTYVHRVDVIQPSHPLTSPSPPVFNLSQHQGLFQWLNSSHLAAKELQLPFHYQPFQWISQLTSFKIEWFDLLSDQGTLKSLPTHHSSKASILQRSAFFMVQC